MPRTVGALLIVSVIIGFRFQGPLGAAPPMVFESREPGGGGAFFSPSFSPHETGAIYVASDMSGVYHTSDSVRRGRSWTSGSCKAADRPRCNSPAIRKSVIRST